MVETNIFENLYSNKGAKDGAKDEAAATTTTISQQERGDNDAEQEAFLFTPELLQDMMIQRRRELLVERLLQTIQSIRMLQVIEWDDDNLTKGIARDEYGTKILSSVAAVSTSPMQLELGGRKASLHWMWQKQDEDDYYIDNRCCLTLLIPDGTIEICSTDKDLPTKDSCSFSKFQWTLEASIASPSNVDDVNHSDNIPTTTSSSSSPTISSFWKIDNLKFIQSHDPQGNKQKFCLQIKDVTLIASLVRTIETNLNGAFRFCPRSVLNLKLGQVCNVPPGENYDEVESSQNYIHSSFTTLLDLIRLPNVILTVHDSSPKRSPTYAFESTENTTMGDVFRYFDQMSNSNGDKNLENNTQQPSNPTFHTPTHQDELEDRKRAIRESMMKQSPSASHTTDSDTQVTASTGSISTIRNSLRFNIGDSLTATGALVATGASFVTPVGAAVSVAALAAKDGIVAAAHKGKDGIVIAAQKGKQVRKEQQKISPLPDDGFVDVRTIDPTKDGNDRYVFGDVTRGVMSSIRERRHKQYQQHPGQAAALSSSNDIDLYIRDKNRLDDDDTSSSTRSSSSYFSSNKGRFVGVMGASAGAAAGAVVAGPVGAIAGSIAGSIGSQMALKKREEQQQQQQQKTNNGESSSTSKAGYKFGDNIRKVVANGKESTGRATDAPYKFGDFSRGLLQKVKNSKDTTK